VQEALSHTLFPSATFRLVCAPYRTINIDCVGNTSTFIRLYIECTLHTDRVRYIPIVYATYRTRYISTLYTTLPGLYAIYRLVTLHIDLYTKHLDLYVLYIDCVCYISNFTPTSTVYAIYRQRTLHIDLYPINRLCTLHIDLHALYIDCVCNVSTMPYIASFLKYSLCVLLPDTTPPSASSRSPPV